MMDNTDKLQMYACWGWVTKNSRVLEFTTKVGGLKRLAEGHIPTDAELQYEFPASSWEEAVKKHKQHQGW